jgi:Family of unknown function (DUF6192)
MSKSLDQWVREDREIAARAESATAALMEHRWRAVKEGGVTVAEYARALGIGHPTVVRYVKGWDLLRTSTGTSPLDAYALAGMGEDKRAAVEVVANAKGIGAQTVERHYAPDVARARATIEATPDREAGIAKAREHAAKVEQVRKREHEQEAARRHQHSRTYLNLEHELGKARRALQNALGWARDSNLDDAEVELIADSLASVRALLDFVNAAIVDEAIDWDTELAKLDGGDAA